MKNLVPLFLILLGLPCCAQERIPEYPYPASPSKTERFCGVKTTEAIRAGSELTSKNTTEFERPNRADNPNEIGFLIYGSNPIATRDIKLNANIQSTDFKYVRKQNSLNLRRPLRSNSHTHGVGDFDRTLKKNIYYPKIEYVERELKPEEVMPAPK